MQTLEELLDDDGILAECSHIASRRRLQVVRRGYGQAMLGLGPKPPLQDAGWYDNSWDFPTAKAALEALKTWNPEQAAEPQGWHRHVATGRFRIRGNACLEYVKDAVGTSIEEQVIYAIKVTQGQDRVIIEVEEDPERSPSGFVFYAAVSESSECTHESRCSWHDRVFYWCGRYVVVAQRDLDATTMGNVRQRLTDPWPNPPGRKEIKEITEKTDKIVDEIMESGIE